MIDTGVMTASMPSNIALIKYMGKKNTARNIPENPSFSYTLRHLTSTVSLRPINSQTDQWQAETSQFLNPEEKARFIKHLDFLKQQYRCQDSLEICSSNNFAVGCGLASSASSFAALTACAVRLFSKTDPDPLTLATLSRQGSGSSCRSFFSPFALWDVEKVIAVDYPVFKNLIHKVIIVSSAKKAISSSQAHQWVKSSALFETREKRARGRLDALLAAFQSANWQAIYQIVWQDFWDMHALFETCAQPFTYLLPESLKILNNIRQYWQKHQDGPLVTMDAGPNIHLLFREDQKNMAEHWYVNE